MMSSKKHPLMYVGMGLLLLPKEHFISLTEKKFLRYYIFIGKQKILR